MSWNTERDSRDATPVRTNRRKEKQRRKRNLWPLEGLFCERREMREVMAVSELWEE
jgi:hypothetical protein